MSMTQCSVFFFVLVCFGQFFFFKQKTAYELRISDWSSDVCSSDLPVARIPQQAQIEGVDDRQQECQYAKRVQSGLGMDIGHAGDLDHCDQRSDQKHLDHAPRPHLTQRMHDVDKAHGLTVQHEQ